MILVVDDHDFARFQFIKWLEEQFTENSDPSSEMGTSCEEIIEADSYSQALQVVNSNVRLAIIDILIPRNSGQYLSADELRSKLGIKLARQLRLRYPSIGILFISSNMSFGNAVEEFVKAHGVASYIVKSGDTVTDLHQAVKAALQGTLHFGGGVQFSDLSHECESFLAVVPDDMNKGLVQTIAQRVRKLNDNQRSTMRQYIILGKPIKQIAFDKKITDGRVQKIIYHARDVLVADLPLGSISEWNYIHYAFLLYEVSIQGAEDDGARS